MTHIAFVSEIHGCKYMTSAALFRYISHDKNTKVTVQSQLSVSQVT